MKTEHVNGIPVRAWDSGGEKFFDRYTVFYSKHGTPGTQEGRGMSAHPFHPLGFGQWVWGVAGPHLGKRIPLGNLPADCRRLVEQDTAAMAQELSPA
jgi:hypothetical protein